MTLDLPPASIISENASDSTESKPHSNNVTNIRAQRPPITKAIDIWALGVTLYCFIFGRCPFIADTEFELFFNVIPKQPLEFPKNIPISDDLRDLLMKLLEKDPNKRITLEEVKVIIIYSDNHYLKNSNSPDYFSLLFDLESSVGCGRFTRSREMA